MRNRYLPIKEGDWLEETAKSKTSLILPEGVREMVDSIHGVLRKPSSETEKTRKIAANLRAKNQRGSVRKNAKSAPSGANTIPASSEAAGVILSTR